MSCRSQSVGIVVIALTLPVLFLSCGTKMDPVIEAPENGLQGTATYIQHVGPLMGTNCTMCHASDLQGADRNGAPTGTDLETYSGVVEWVERSNARIQAGSMPPFGGLASTDRELFQTWIDQGLIVGGT